MGHFQALVSLTLYKATHILAQRGEEYLEILLTQVRERARFFTLQLVHFIRSCAPAVRSEYFHISEEVAIARVET